MAKIAGGAVAGPLERDLTNVTGVTTYNVLSTDDFVQVTTGSSVVTVNMPAPAAAGTFNSATMTPAQSTLGSLGNAGQTVTIQKIDSGAGTVTIAGTLNIGKVYGLANKWSSATFTSDGTNWNLVATVS